MDVLQIIANIFQIIGVIWGIFFGGKALFQYIRLRRVPSTGAITNILLTAILLAIIALIPVLSSLAPSQKRGNPQPDTTVGTLSHSTVTPVSTITSTVTQSNSPTSSATFVLTNTPIADGSSYTLDFGDSTYVDLDTGHADLIGGANDEVFLSFGRFFFGNSEKTWAKTQVVYINDSQVSYQGCSNGTLIQQDPAHIDSVQQDQTICVATSKGNWAAMKIVNINPSSSGIGDGDITFKVKLFHS